jgi:hypothetical protein
MLAFEGSVYEILEYILLLALLSKTVLILLIIDPYC